MDVTYLSDILKKVSDNSIDVDTALESLKHLPYEDIGYANIDQHRNLRTGEAEVIFGQSKTPEQIAGKIPVPKEEKGTIAVVTAGTSDIPVAEEAALTAEFFGDKVDRVYDVGVAGIHRLFGKIDQIRSADVIIVIAGMEGALASVVGGLVEVPVIAVPTSVGYGASFGGLAALLSMLNSCANGIGVVNIDNGYGAACLANKIMKR